MSEQSTPQSADLPQRPQEPADELPRRGLEGLDDPNPPTPTDAHREAVEERARELQDTGTIRQVLDKLREH